MPSIKKINSILELLRQNYKMGLTNKEISEILNMPPSTCYRILGELRKYKFIYQRKSDMKYFLGFANLRFADAVVEGMDITTLSLPYLEELHKETEETTFLAVWQEPVCVVVEVVGFINTRVSVGRGEIMPFHASAAGKLVLAFLPGKKKNKILDTIELKKYTEKIVAIRIPADNVNCPKENLGKRARLFSDLLYENIACKKASNKITMI